MMHSENCLDFISIRVREDNLMYLFFNDKYAFSFDSFLPKVILHALDCEFTFQNYSSQCYTFIWPELETAYFTESSRGNCGT